MGEALAELDRSGVAHGDVKPANILLTRTRSTAGDAWRASLVDLGLAGDASNTSPSGGTLRYMPPELWVGARGGDGRARDRFALGLVLAEVLVPDLARSADLTNDARKAHLPAPFDRWCGALLAPDPGARPRAGWIAEEARLSSDANFRSETATKERAAIRAAYLGSRRAELVAAARAATVEVRVGGEAGRCMAHAVAMASSIERLRGAEMASSLFAIADADALARARWLTALVGSTAARWPIGTLSSATDEELYRGLSSLVDRKRAASWTLADIENATAAPARAPSPTLAEPTIETPVDVALALSGERRRAAIDAIERGVVSSSVLRRAAADALRRMGESGRALALLADDGEAVARSLRAETARRAGDSPLAEREARAAILHDPGDHRALYVLARLAVDAGDPTRALALLSNAPRSAWVCEARAIALVASGDRVAAAPEIAFAEALASTEEAEGRAAGLRGYVAHQNGDVAASAVAYARAAEHAERAGALVEEATYLHGLAAVAVDAGDIGHALEAARRASLLWEHLGRPGDAA